MPLCWRQSLIYSNCFGDLSGHYKGTTAGQSGTTCLACLVFGAWTSFRHQGGFCRRPRLTRPGYVQPDGSYGPRQSALMAKEWREAKLTKRRRIGVQWMCCGAREDSGMTTKEHVRCPTADDALYKWAGLNCMQCIWVRGEKHPLKSF